ncbi:MAG: type IV toxin-antitoxin system AbiEi family antitoxin [Ignavibacteria bacterium]|nr:type IV toxin-antitoxin system AbiEi family antitoxin [Ignavibacteria bacterium]
MSRAAKTIEKFFSSHPVFRYEELRKSLPDYQNREQAFKNFLLYHKKKGNLISIQKGVYAVVSRGDSPEDTYIDPLLLASKLTDDAIIGYQSALQYHGSLHSERFETIILTKKKLPSLRVKNETFRYTQYPKTLLEKGLEKIEIEKIQRLSHFILVTTPERTFVDVLDRPWLIGHDWEEITHSLEKTYIGRPQALLHYLQCLGSATTAARVGYFIERKEGHYNISEEIIEQIYALRPNNPVFLDCALEEDHCLVKKWNLKIPLSLANSIWEENALLF